MSEERKIKEVLSNLAVKEKLALLLALKDSKNQSRRESFCLPVASLRT